jgi:voltage-gated potassium channel
MHDLRRFCFHFWVGVHLLRHILTGLIVALLLLALVIWWAEDRSFGDAVYLTLITGLTVGYGDISPVTLAGRTASILAALIGVIITGIYVAIATNAVSHCVNEKNRSITHLASSKTAATPAGSRPEV